VGGSTESKGFNREFASGIAWDTAGKLKCPDVSQGGTMLNNMANAVLIAL
jgi:hypothetical protein